jgi:hypothetical protein
MHYVLPVMPVVVLLIARNLTNMKVSEAVDRLPIFIILISIGIVLVFLPLIPLKGGDREMLSKLPVWLPAIPMACALPLLFFKRTTYDSIKLISLCSVTLFIGLHVSLKDPLYDTYDQNYVGNFLQHFQTDQRPIAVFPGELSDQFQFAGKLKQTLYPAKSHVDLRRWASAHPRGYSLLYVRNKNDLLQFHSKVVSEYKNGWLVILSSSDLNNQMTDTLN